MRVIRPLYNVLRITQKQCPDIQHSLFPARHIFPGKTHCHVICLPTPSQQHHHPFPHSLNHFINVIFHCSWRHSHHLHSVSHFSHSNITCSSVSSSSMSHIWNTLPCNSDHLQFPTFTSSAQAWKGSPPGLPSYLPSPTSALHLPTPDAHFCQCNTAARQMSHTFFPL